MIRGAALCRVVVMSPDPRRRHLSYAISLLRISLPALALFAAFAGAFFATVSHALTDAGSLTAVRSQWFGNVAIDGNLPTESDLFAMAVATGDFNGDGAADLATGMPWDDGPADQPLTDAGAVVVRWGIPGHGLGSATTLLSLYASGGVTSAQAFDHYGYALAAGDFNGDGRDDLAVGLPSRYFDRGGGTDQGAVQIHLGLPGGIELAGQLLLRPGIDGVPDTPNSDDDLGSDVFGFALAAGDFNADGYADLAIGAPQNSCAWCSAGGGVVVLHGGFGGLTVVDSFLIYQDDPQIPDTTEGPDDFGFSLTTGNFNGDFRCFLQLCLAYDDLAISAPGEDDEGAVMVLYGSDFSLLFGGAVYLGQGDVGGSGGEAGDRFGSVLASGDIDGDTFDELAIGTPLEDLGPGNVFTDAGEVTLLFGAAAGFNLGRTERLAEGAFHGSPGSSGTKFGSGIAVADFDHDGRADLAVGVPGMAVQGPGAGAALVLLGESNGDFSRYRFQFPGFVGVPPGEQNFAAFGTSLAAGDFDHDHHADLVIGIPYRDLAGVADVGAETVLYGALFADGFETQNWSFWSGSAP